jgi:Cd(II)/Pb(II)-responsive transcriptional regulator
MRSTTNEGMRIGELARRAGCQVETVRYYERAGLLPAPLRSSSNYRLYDAAHVERLSFIRRCRSLGMALDEIRTLLRFRDTPDESCGGVGDLLDAHIQHVADRIGELQQLEKQLEALRRQCGESRPSRHCGILRDLSSMDALPTPTAPEEHDCVQGPHGLPRGQ